MRRWIIWLVLLGCGLAACTGVTAPQIWVEDAEFNFGVAIEGDSVVHSFLIENRGTEVLVIERVRTGCGCTASRLTTQELQPGESTELRITFRTSGYGGRVISMGIQVFSNDPETPELHLFLKGSVEKDPLCQIEPGDFLAQFYVLIDLREPEQFARGRLMGAINIPLSELADWIEYLPPRVNIVLYDQDGSTVLSALEQLTVSGVTNVCGLIGGIARWVEEHGTHFLVSFRLLRGEL